MTAETAPRGPEAAVRALYEATSQQYRDFLEDSGREPYPYIADRPLDINSYGVDLFSAVAAKLAQQQGIGVRITFLAEAGDGYTVSADRPSSAIISYASQLEELRNDALWGTVPDDESAILRAALMPLDYEGESLNVVSSLRAGVSPEELAKSYPYLRGLLKLYKSDDDLAIRLVAHQYLRGYCKGDLAGLGGALDGVVDQLVKLLRRLDLSNESAAERQAMTAGLAANNRSTIAKKETMEALVAAGYTPLAPDEYAHCVSRVFMGTL